MAGTDAFLVRGVDFVRDFSQDTIDEVRWTENKIIELLCMANCEVYEEMMAAAEPRTYRNFTEFTFTVTADQQDYLFPASFRKFIRLVKKDDDGNILKEILQTDYYSGLSGMVLMSGRRGIRITPVPEDTETSWTLVYEAGPVPLLHYGDGAYTASTLILTLDSTPTKGWFVDGDDYYAGCYVKALSGSGGIGLVSQVSTNDGTSATLVRPFKTSPGSSPTYEIMPSVDQPFDNLIMWKAVMKMKAADGDRSHYELADREYRSTLRSVLSRAGDIQSRQGPGLGSSFLDPMDYGEYSL